MSDDVQEGVLSADAHLQVALPGCAHMEHGRLDHFQVLCDITSCVAVNICSYLDPQAKWYAYMLGA